MGPLRCPRLLWLDLDQHFNPFERLAYALNNSSVDNEEMISVEPSRNMTNC